MLVAVSSITNSRVIADEVDSTHPCKCPECCESVIHKSGSIVIPHFAHYAKTNCSLSEGESIRHLQMKTQIAKRLKGTRVDFEVSVIAGHRADVWLPDFNIAVECQASPILIADWRERTLDYSSHGVAVMWVWDICRLYGTKRFQSFPGCEPDPYHPPEEFRVPAEIRHCASLSDDEVFSLDLNGILKVCRLNEPATRFNEWYDEDGEFCESEYTPKTLRRILHRPARGSLREDVHTGSPYRLVRCRFYEEPQWERTLAAMKVYP